jgi:hypothetical protein
LAADDPAGQPRFVAFVRALQELGWTDERNVRIDRRWAAGKADMPRGTTVAFGAFFHTLVD